MLFEFWWLWSVLMMMLGMSASQLGSVCGNLRAPLWMGVRATRKFFSRNKEDKEKSPGAARKLLSELCPVGIPLPAHTSGETSDKSNSFVMLCWMRAYCVQ